MTPPVRSQPTASGPAPVRTRRPRFGWRDAPLLAEALATLGWASAAIARMPFQRVASMANDRVRPGSRTQGADIDRVEQAVQAWARRVPWRTVCFQKGLAVHIMLRRRGIASRMHYGVRQTPAEGLGAHVWVRVGDRDVVGGEEAARFACLAIYPVHG